MCDHMIYRNSLDDAIGLTSAHLCISYRLDAAQYRHSDQQDVCRSLGVDSAELGAAGAEGDAKVAEAIRTGPAMMLFFLFSAV